MIPLDVWACPAGEGIRVVGGKFAEAWACLGYRRAFSMCGASERPLTASEGEGRLEAVS